MDQSLFFAQMQLINDGTAGLTAAAGLVFLLRNAGKRAEGTGAYAGWLQAILYSFVAAVALDHLAVGGPIAGSTERTGHGTALAANTVGIVVDREPGLRVLADAAHRAGCNAGRIIAVHTGGGDVRTIGASICQRNLIIEGLTVTLVTGGQINVILIHAAHHTGGTSTALILIEYKNVFHRTQPS